MRVPATKILCAFLAACLGAAVGGPASASVGGARTEKFGFGNGSASGRPPSRRRMRSEESLAGVDIYHSTISNVIRLYGQPLAFRDETDPADDPPGSGTRDYTWVIHGVKLLVHTGYYTGARGDTIVEGIISVEVWGAGPGGGAGRTGAGLALGDGYERALQLYGPPRNSHFLGSGVMEYVFNLTPMDIWLCSDGRINHIELSIEE